MMPDSSFSLQGAVSKGYREVDRGALPARLRSLEHRPALRAREGEGRVPGLLFLPLALPLLKLLDLFQHLRPESRHVEILLQGLLCPRISSTGACS
jgi:hypothetical protein